MPVQFLSDAKGNTTAVLVPIEQWREISSIYKKEVLAKEMPPAKKELLKGIKEALQEVKQIESGKKKGTSLKQFLDEL